MISTLLQGSSSGQAGVKLIADPRSNTILLTGDPAARRHLHTLIAQLDTPTTAAGTQVIYLHYAQAKDITTQLKAYAKSLGQSAIVGTGVGTSIVESASIIPDARTNALIVTAPPRVQQRLRSVIAKLDVPLPQVLIRTIEAELSNSRSAQLGVTWVTDKAGLALTDFSDTGPGIVDLAESAAGGTGISGIAIPQGLSLVFGKINGRNGYTGLVNALAGDADTDVLSTPNIVALDNQEADIKVAEQIPFVTGQYTNTGGGGSTAINPFQTVQRQDVGLELKITPEVNSDNTVSLKVDVEISALSGSSIGGQPVTDSRVIKTQVLARSGEIIVLGTLLSDNLIENAQQVPIVGSIPLLGNLFKYRSTTDTNDNLVLFIQPTILRNPQDSEDYARTHYDETRNLERAHPGGVNLMPGEPRPVLQPWPQAPPETPVPATPTHSPPGAPLPPAKPPLLLQARAL